MSVFINFINKSNNPNPVNVVIFQKNVANNFEELAVAWRVITCKANDIGFKFSIPPNFQIGSIDSWGNVSNLLTTVNGQRWMVVRSTSGDIFVLDSSPAHSFATVEVKNALITGSISVQIYKDGKLLDVKNSLSPQQTAVFEFKPTIWVGVVSNDIEEGDILNSAILSTINTQISFIDIQTADLVMTGGGPGTSPPYVFTLVPTS
jgi:hypothetical protein